MRIPRTRIKKTDPELHKSEKSDQDPNRVKSGPGSPQATIKCSHEVIRTVLYVVKIPGLGFVLGCGEVLLAPGQARGGRHPPLGHRVQLPPSRV
jgi:hypothetical protein